MTLVQLKKFIASGNIPSDFMIFIDKDNKFLTEQYVEAIGKQSVGGLYKISSIYEPIQSSTALLAKPPEATNILRTDIFEERAEDYFQFENTIVVCSQIDKNIADKVKNFVIQMPKFEDWQIYDYIKLLCPVLDQTEIQMLIKVTNGDMYRIANELAKVQVFLKEEQKQILNSILFDPQTDLYNADLFTIVNALTDGDLPTLFNFISHKNFELFEPVVLANRVLSSLKNILLITQNPTARAADLGVSTAQQKFIMNKYRNININAIKHKIKFLADVDLNLKSSKLMLSKQSFLTYLVANLCFKIN